MMRRVVLVVITTVGLSLVAVAPAQAAFTSTLAGTTATVTGDSAVVDQIDIGKSGGNLTLNGSVDWDSATGGDQTLADGAASSVVVNAGDGVDIITVGPAGTTFASTITVNGEGGADFVHVYAGGSGADTVTITGNGIDGPGTGHVGWTASTDQVNIRTGDGADTVNVTGTPTSPQVLVYAEGGDDQLKLADGTGLGSGGTFRGGPGTDKLDYSAYTAPVTVDLGQTASFRASLTGANEVPPTGSAATADGFLTFSSLATNTFDYELDPTGLTAVQITDSHIHSGAAGTNGPVILPIGPGSSWSAPGTPMTEAFNLTDPDITEPALRAGNTYFNIHTATNPGGDIRGQLTLDPNDGYGGSGTGLTKVFTVENVTGGTGNDTLKGSVPANTFDCGPGQDMESTDLADTVTGCEKVIGSATVTGVSPASPADNTTPKVKGTTTPANLNVKIYTNSACTGPAAASGTSAQFAAGGIPVPVADGSLTTFYATVADTAAESACSTSSASYQELKPVGSISSLKPKAKAKGAKVTIDTGATATCPAAATGSCAVTGAAKAKIGKKTVTLGKAKATVAAGTSLRVVLKVSKQSAAAWRQAGKLKITVTVTITVPGGAPVTVTKTVKLKAPPA